MNEKPDMMINIYGGNNLIAPVASSAIQNFYGDRGDEDRETVTELLLIDDEDTLLLNDELLKGLDEELDAFLKDLLEK